MIYSVYVCDGCGRRLETTSPPAKTPDELEDWLIIGRRRVIPRADEIGLPEVHLCRTCIEKNPLGAVAPS